MEEQRASASKPAGREDDEEPFAQMELGVCPDLDPDSIDLLTEPTPCALLIKSGGQQIEAAWDQVYPKQTKLHIVPILDDCAVVKVEYALGVYKDHVLELPPNDEITKLREAVLQRIQWKRAYIVVKTTPKEKASSQTVAQLPSTPPYLRPKDSQTSASGAAKSSPSVPSREPAAAAKSAPSVPSKEPIAATKSAAIVPSKEPEAAAKGTCCSH